MIQGVMSADPEIQLAAVGRFRKILSKGKLVCVVWLVCKNLPNETKSLMP
jgi:hypothetical protein